VKCLSIKNKYFIPSNTALYRTQKLKPVSSADTCLMSPPSVQKTGVMRDGHRTDHT